MDQQEDQNKVKIAVCIPWDSPFVWTAPMFNMANWERPDNSDVRFIMGVGWGADLVMFNGADHLCPKDIMVKMLSRINEGWDMVHVMPPSRGICGYDGAPFKALSYKVIGPMPQIDAILHAPPSSIQVLSYDDEPQQSHISGTGNIMMKAEIFDGLQKPYFEEFIKKDGKYSRYAVQDSSFTFRCTVEGGARMFCDTSIKIVHLDAFGIDETYSERFKDKTGQMDWSPAKDLRGFV
jgi:hypothetical protein